MNAQAINIYMIRYSFYVSFCTIMASCKMLAGSDAVYANENGKYKLGLNPEVGSQYSYDITNETEVKLEVNGREVQNLNKSTVALLYIIDRDSAGNFIFKTRYDKIHLYTKNGEKETDKDAARSDFSTDPVERMLGALKAASIVSTINASGEVKDVTGYKEVGTKIIESFDPNDIEGKSMAQQQWNQLIEKELVRKNLVQLFEMFPDSSVRLGEKWKLDSRHEGGFNLHASAFYKLSEIDKDVTIIESEGEMRNDSVAVDVKGAAVLTSLKGKQQGRYKMETASGMLISSTLTSDLEGTIQVMGRDVPVVIKTIIQVKGKRLK